MTSLNIKETDKFHDDIIMNEKGQNMCEVEIDVYDIYSPNLEDSEIIVRVNFGKLFLMFDPLTINTAVKFFRNVKSSRKKDIESLKHQLMTEFADNSVDKIQQQQTCSSIKLILIKAIIKASGLSIMTCHHTYSTPIFEMEVGNSEFSYLMFYDHDIIEGSFNQAKVFDLT